MSQHKLHVLVVEDEASLVELLRYNLEKEGFRVTAANDGEEALALLKEGKPDLLVLDWMLPHVSGIEICRQVRRRPELRDLPVIMLTARGEEADRVRGLEVGAADYVITYLQELRRNPPAVGQYRVISGSGELLAAGSADGDQFTL
ncbi:MAG: response regulator, partial [Alphaproteobacteria bacterium]